MKKIYLLSGVAAFLLVLSGCSPELDQTQLSPEEQAWAQCIKDNYGAWQQPESIPRSVRRDDIAQGNYAAEAVPAPVDQTTIPAAADDAALIAPETTVPSEPAAVVEAPVAAADAANPEMVEYTVVKGDTLGGIARKVYGRASAWKKIQDANADLLKGKTLIRPGMKLQIPRP